MRGEPDSSGWDEDNPSPQQHLVLLPDWIERWQRPPDHRFSVIHHAEDLVEMMVRFTRADGQRVELRYDWWHPIDSPPGRVLMEMVDRGEAELIGGWDYLAEQQRLGWPSRTVSGDGEEQPRGEGERDEADEGEDEPDPTSAERLLYALGQLYRRWYRGGLSVEPRDLSVPELARTIGVSRDIEMVTEAPYGTAYHFEGEVLVVFPVGRFPWAVWSTEEWARYCEFEDFAAGFGWD